MKIAALGDAHLGRAYYPATTDSGVNQREADFEQSFTDAVELALAQSPDLVVWLGDVFDHPRPTYRSYRVAQRGLARVREHGIPAVVISGNHDTPRLPGTGSPYSALADAYPDVRFAHRLTYERFELPGLVVHAVPQMLTVEATLDALRRADNERSLDKVNLLLTHPMVTSVERRYADVNEIEVDAGDLRSDLVLLGHYHFHLPVALRVWYAGATDTFSFADDPERAKGIVVLDTDSGECTHVALEGQRPLVTLDDVEALGLAPAEVQGLVAERLSHAPAGSVARLYVKGVDPEAWQLLDHAALRETAAHVLHYKLERDFAGVAKSVELPELESMPARWTAYIDEQDLVGFDRERVSSLGVDYLARAVEEAV
jgi:DNA repair exonuclease SbcCD nuclease subunit